MEYEKITVVIQCQSRFESKILQDIFSKLKANHNNGSNLDTKRNNPKSIVESEYYLFCCGRSHYLGWSHDYSKDTTENNYYRRDYCTNVIEISTYEFLKITRFKNIKKCTDYKECIINRYINRLKTVVKGQEYNNGGVTGTVNNPWL